MGLLGDIFKKSEAILRTYTGDHAFLAAAAAAAANVVAADGEIEDTEIEAAIKGMMSNPVIKQAFSPSAIEEALSSALSLAKTRSGRIQNARAIEAARTRAPEQKQDIFLVAADVTDGNSKSGLGPKEQEALNKIADALGIDGKKLLG